MFPKSVPVDFRHGRNAAPGLIPFPWRLLPRVFYGLPKPRPRSSYSASPTWLSNGSARIKFRRVEGLLKIGAVTSLMGSMLRNKNPRAPCYRSTAHLDKRGVAGKPAVGRDINLAQSWLPMLPGRRLQPDSARRSSTGRVMRSTIPRSPRPSRIANSGMFSIKILAHIGIFNVFVTQSYTAKKRQRSFLFLQSRAPVR